MMSALRAGVLQMVSHWFPRLVWMMSCPFTCMWLTTGWDVLEGRSGGTWLPDEFPAPLFWRRRNSVRTGMTKPERSEGVNEAG